MIGNDIVDLEAAAKESNWRRKGFLQKLFTAEERKKILLAANSEKFVWLLWSMKEAAYKAQQRRLKCKRSYQPHRIVCTSVSLSETSAYGTISYEDSTYMSRSVINNKYIHTTAALSEGEKIMNRIFTSSNDLKPDLVSQVASIYELNKLNIFIKKDKNNIPHLLCQDQLLSTSFSISHHGNFSAYALSLMNY